MSGLFAHPSAPKVVQTAAPVDKAPPNINGALTGQQSQQVSADTTPLNPASLTRSQFLGF